MYARFLRYAKENNLFDKEKRVLIAVSGGVDSVALLHLLCRAAQQSALPLSLFVAHCNFQLRGESSDKDQAFVTSLAKDAGIPFFTVNFDTKAYAQKQKLSIEMAARELRYHFFEELIEVEHLDACALAHHADDQAETQWINLLRGTGIKGLRGMEPRKGFYLRPLLFARRTEIEAYVQEQKLNHREDETNAQDEYLRNRIRHHLMPLCETLNPQSVRHMEQLAQSMRYTEEVLENWYKQTRGVLVQTEPEGEIIPAKKIAEFKKKQGLLSLLCFFEWYLKERNFTGEQMGQIILNIRQGEGNKTFENREGKAVLMRTSRGWIYRPY